jgi:hypothetical protein
MFYLIRRQNRAALQVTLFGFLAGGVGFAVGNFVNMLGRAQWGPIGRFESLQGLDYWKWMEQLFGLIMGIGVSLAFLRWIRPKLATPAEDQSGGKINTIGLLFLLIVMMWANLHKNVLNWAKGSHIPESLFGVPAQWWFLVVGLILSSVILVAVVRRHRRTLPLTPSCEFGQGQLLFLVILWIAIAGAFTQALPAMAGKGVFFVHVTFWITGGICSLIVLGLSGRPISQSEVEITTSDQYWKAGRRYWISWLLVPILIILLAYLTTAAQDEPLSGHHLRFTKNMQQ